MRLTTPRQIVLDLSTTDRAGTSRLLAETLLDEDRLTDLDGFLADVARREAQMTTSLPGGIAIPHSRSDHVAASSVAFGRSATGIDWGAADGLADLIFLIAVPRAGSIDHLAILARLARRLTHPEFRVDLRRLPDAEAVSDLLEQVLTG